jgi:hypothetical protein
MPRCTQRSFLPGRHVAPSVAFRRALPFLAFFLSGPLPLSVVEFLACVVSLRSEVALIGHKVSRQPVLFSC